MITRDKLLALLMYDPETGLFTNRVQRGVRGVIGSVTGSVDKDGYIIIQIEGQKYKAHRLAWLYMTGEWPVEEIDHVDGFPANNAWINLREATRGDNVINSKRAVGLSGSRGVKFDPSTTSWRARIQYGGIRMWLGPFDTIEEAENAYLIAAERLHGEYALHHRPEERT